MSEAPYTIRPAREEDFPAVAELEDLLLRLHAGRRPDVFQYTPGHYRQEWYEAFLSGENLGLMAEVDGQIVGMCLSKVAMTDAGPILRQRKDCKIEDLAVFPAFRRRGIASALLRETEALARSRGCQSVQLNVWALDREAAQLYERAGYAPLRQILERPLT